MITTTGLELRAGARILISEADLRVQPGDRIGLVGRNGAGKTTSMRVLAGEGEPYSGTVSANSAVGYLPQDPREGDLTVTAKAFPAAGCSSEIRTFPPHLAGLLGWSGSSWRW